jgi:hypothetical protein
MALRTCTSYLLLHNKLQPKLEALKEQVFIFSHFLKTKNLKGWIWLDVSRELAAKLCYEASVSTRLDCN